MEKLVFIGDLQVYQEQADRERANQYQRLLEQADSYHDIELPTEHPKKSTTYMGIAIVNLALAFRLSQKEKYLSEAKRVMDTVLSYEKWGNAHLVNVDLSASWILFGLSLGYDWLKPYLGREESERIASKIKHHAKIIYDYKLDTHGAGWSTNYYQNHNWINMTGLAAAGYALQGEDEAAPKYIEAAKENFSRVFSYLADDGSNYEGVVYWRYGGMWLFIYAHLLKQQEGIDYFRTCSYLKNTFYYRLYQACGDFRQQMNFGDCHDRHSGHTPCVYYKAAAEYRDGFAQKVGNMVLSEFLMEEANESKVKPGILPEAAFEFLWYDPSVEERSLETLPKSRYFGDLGLLMIRESWEADSKVLTIKCGYPGGKKQWKQGWELYRQEGIDCLALSHHHPDNLSYIFARGREYLTCEDGYNRNIMPDHHNVILVDQQYTDAEDVNDVYMSSVKIRMENDSSEAVEQTYFGDVTCFYQEDSMTLYQGEATGIYPRALKMKEVSRLLFTDNLAFWVFIDICKSDIPHIYQIICNTDDRAEGKADGSFLYPMDTGNIQYSVFSDKEIKTEAYEQHIVSVMTTQEPDKVCETSMQTLATKSRRKEREQVFFECFTFEEEGTKVLWENYVLSINNRGRDYEFYLDEQGVITVKVSGDGMHDRIWKLYDGSVLS